jgi:hypothetical protein
MREQLAARNGQRLTVTASVLRRGTVVSWLGVLEHTLCLGPMQTLDGQTLADRVWFKLGRRLAALQLHAGDVVRPAARVKPYKKNRIRRPGKPFTYSVDYRLAYPSNVQRLIATQSKEEYVS